MLDSRTTRDKEFCQTVIIRWMEEEEMTMTNSYRIVLPLCLMGFVILSGCIQSKETYTLNPDGSGKVVYELTAPLAPDLMGTKQSDPEVQARNSVDKLLKESSGIDTWADISWSLTDDAKLYFKGTAYFPDYNQVQLSQGEMKSSIKENLRFRKQDDQRLFLSFEDQTTTNSPAVVLSPEQLQETIRQKKFSFMQSRPMLNGILKDMMIEEVYVLPGNIIRADSFTMNEERSEVLLRYDGDKILNAFDELMKNDLFWEQEALRSDEDDKLSMHLFNQTTFGSTSMTMVIIEGPFKPLFDYAAEVSAAKAAYPDLIKSLQLADQPEKSVPVSGEGLKHIKVGGIKLVYADDVDFFVRPFNQQAGLTISMLASFGRPLLEIKKVRLSMAETISGQNLVPEKTHDREARNARLSKDKTIAVFELNMKTPGNVLEQISILSGEITYLTGGLTTNVDLGLLPLKVGTTSESLGAEIIKTGKSRWGNEDSHDVEILLASDPDFIKEIRFENAGGEILEFKSSGSVTSGQSGKYTYRFERELPAEARIIVERYIDLKEVTVPFKLEKIDLLNP